MTNKLKFKTNLDRVKIKQKQTMTRLLKVRTNWQGFMTLLK